MPHVCFYGRVEQRLTGLSGIEVGKPACDVGEKGGDTAVQLRAVKQRIDRRRHRSTALVPQYDEERRLKISAGVLQRSENLRAGDVPATRITKSSPKPASKTNSGGTRLSLQPRMVANGYCSFV
jgi:hypothetical protein